MFIAKFHRVESFSRYTHFQSDFHIKHTVKCLSTNFTESKAFYGIHIVSKFFTVHTISVSFSHHLYCQMIVDESYDVNEFSTVDTLSLSFSWCIQNHDVKFMSTNRTMSVSFSQYVEHHDVSQFSTVLTMSKVCRRIPHSRNLSKKH